MSIKIRMAETTDSSEILAIYSPYVEDTSISFEYVTPSQEEFLQRIKDISEEYPYLVCTRGDEIIGYAYAHRYGERAAYQWSAELSIYIRQDCRRMGLGRALYTALMEILKLQNVYNVYGCVTYPNQPSENLHEAMGFRRLGVFRSVGFKQDSWRDVTWFEKNIIEYGAKPKPLKTIKEVDEIAVEDILCRCADMVKVV